MSKRLHIDNLPLSAKPGELRSLFEQYGEITSAIVTEDPESGRPRGFAFVEYEAASSAAMARQALDGHEYGGRTMRISEGRYLFEQGGATGEVVHFLGCLAVGLALFTLVAYLLAQLICRANG